MFGMRKPDIPGLTIFRPGITTKKEAIERPIGSSRLVVHNEAGSIATLYAHLRLECEGCVLISRCYAGCKGTWMWFDMIKVLSKATTSKSGSSIEPGQVSTI